MAKYTSCLFFFSTMNSTLHPIKAWLPSKLFFTLSFAAVGDRRNSHHAENMVIACTHTDCHWALFAVQYGSNCFFVELVGCKSSSALPHKVLCRMRHKHRSPCSSTGLGDATAAEGSISGSLLSVVSLLSKTATNTYNFTHAKPPFF